MQNPRVPSAGGAAAVAPVPSPTVTRVRIPTRVQPHTRIAPEAGAPAAATVAAEANIPVAAASIAAASSSSSVSSSRSASSATPPAASPAMAREVSAQSTASVAAAFTPTPTPAVDEFPPSPAESPTRYVAVTLPDPPQHTTASSAAAVTSSSVPASQEAAPIAPPSAAASSASNPIGVSSDEEMGDVDDDDEALSTAPSAAAAATSLDRCFCSDPHALQNDLVCSRYDEQPWLHLGGVKCYTTHLRCVRTAEGLPFEGYVLDVSSFLCRACITRPGFTPAALAGYKCTFQSEAGHFYDPIPPEELQMMQQQQQQQQQAEMEMENECAHAAAAAAAVAALPSTPPRAPPSVAHSTASKPHPSPSAPRPPSSAAAASVASSSAASKFDSGGVIDLSGDVDEILDLTAPSTAPAVMKPVRMSKSAARGVASSTGPFAPVIAPFVLRRLVLSLDGARVDWPRRLDADHSEDDATACVRICPYKPPGPRSSRIRNRKERAMVVQALRELDESMEGGGGDTESDTEDRVHHPTQNVQRIATTRQQPALALGKKATAAATKAKPRAPSSSAAVAASASSSSAAATAATAPPAPSFPAIQHSMSASGRPIFWCRCDCKQRCAHMHAEHAQAAEGLASKERSFESLLRPLFEPGSSASTSSSSSSDASALFDLCALGSTLLPGLLSLFDSTGVSVDELSRMPPALLHKCMCQVAHAHSAATYSVLLRHFPSPSALPRSHL